MFHIHHLHFTKHICPLHHFVLRLIPKKTGSYINSNLFKVKLKEITWPIRVYWRGPWREWRTVHMVTSKLQSADWIFHSSYLFESRSSCQHYVGLTFIKTVQRQDTVLTVTESEDTEVYSSHPSTSTPSVHGQFITIDNNKWFISLVFLHWLVLCIGYISNVHGLHSINHLLKFTFQNMKLHWNRTYT